MSGKTPFVIYQGAWNVLQRDFERDIIPMARAEGLALAPWNVLAAGKLRTDEEEEKRRQTGEKGERKRNVPLHTIVTLFVLCPGRTLGGPEWERNETERKVSNVLQEVATEVGARSIQAGKSLAADTTNSSLDVIHAANSRDCIPDAEDAVRLPHSRRAEGRTSAGKHRSPRHRAYRRTR